MSEPALQIENTVLQAEGEIFARLEQIRAQGPREAPESSEEVGADVKDELLSLYTALYGIFHKCGDQRAEDVVADAARALKKSSFIWIDAFIYISNVLNITYMREGVKTQKIVQKDNGLDAHHLLQEENRILRQTIAEQQATIRRQVAEIARLTASPPSSDGYSVENIDTLVNRDDNPELYDLLCRLREMNSEQRRSELDKIYSNIPKFLGVRIESRKAIDYLNDNWGVWIKLGLAIKADVRKYCGASFISQIHAEALRSGINIDDILPSRWTISRIAQEKISPELERAALAKRRSHYRRRSP